MKLLGRVPKRHRDEEHWALAAQVKTLSEQLHKVTESKLEGTTDGLKHEFESSMAAYGDTHWSKKKKEVFQSIWHSDYQDSLLVMHEEFPELKELICSLVLGDHRLRNLERPGTEEARELQGVDGGAGLLPDEAEASGPRVCSPLLQ